jgi:hypothetical protein
LDVSDGTMENLIEQNVKKDLMPMDVKELILSVKVTVNLTHFRYPTSVKMEYVTSE